MLRRFQALASVSFPRFLALAFLLASAASVAWPVLLLPFVNVLPFLETHTFADRFVVALAMLVCAVTTAWVTSTSNRRRQIVRMHLPEWHQKVLAVPVLAVAAAFAAMLSANTLGSLAWASPGRPYTQSFSIVGIVPGGSKYRSVELQLSSTGDLTRRSVVLSKRLFNYPKFQVGSQITLVGKSTIFGVYVERFEVKKPTDAADT
jgi:hypothetical protein